MVRIASRDSVWVAYMSDDFESGSHGQRAMGESTGGRGTDLGDGEVQRPLDLIEVSGRIKWFDVSKGFGFILPDDGSADVLVHITCLRRDGFSAASEGARIVVEATERPRGWQASG